MNPYKRIVNIGIFGEINVGKCTLLKRLTIDYGNISDSYNFTYDNSKYHVFPIPCIEPDINENYELGIINADVAIVLLEYYSIEKGKEYLRKVIIDAYVNNVEKVVICLNKKDLCKGTHCDKDSDDKIKEVSVFIDELLVTIKGFYTLNEIEFVYLSISASEGIGLDELVSLLQLNTKENENNEDIIMTIHDYYIDKDNNNNHLVITGKHIQGPSIKLDTLLQINSTINMKPSKICNYLGDYVSQCSKGEFSTLKFNLDSDTGLLISKNILITSANKPIIEFKAFEAEIMFFELPCLLISQGFKTLFKAGAIMQECSFDKLQSLNGKSVIKNKPFIVPEINGVLRLIITLKEDIMRDKYEVKNYLGGFMLIHEGKKYACGKILKYKPS